MEVWQHVAGRAGVVVSEGTSSGSRLPPTAVSKRCPEDGEGRSGMQLQQSGAASAGQS